MKKLLKTIVALVLIGMWFVPWPEIFGPMMEPHLRGEVPAEELEYMSQLAVGLIVYPAMFVLIIILATVAFIKEKRAPKAPSRGPAPPPRATADQLTAAERRQREKKRKQAEAAGDLLLTLAFIDADKKRK